MIGEPRQSLSDISLSTVLKNKLCRDDAFAVLFEANGSHSDLYDAAFANMLGSSCKFVVIAGRDVHELKECLLDYLVDHEELVIPFFDYDEFEEAMQVFLFGDLPIDSPYDCIFISMSDFPSALAAGRSVLDAASRGQPQFLNDNT